MSEREARFFSRIEPLQGSSPLGMFRSSGPVPTQPAASIGLLWATLDTDEADPALPFRWRIGYLRIAEQNQWWHEMERLNYFSSYQSKGAGHEDQLTRAFLVVVRMVPLALAGLLDLIRDQQVVRGSATAIPSSTELLTHDVEIETQKNSISQSTGRLVSVVMPMRIGDAISRRYVEKLIEAERRKAAKR
jgi:hypothetical protein